ncbi:hypothetical protein HJC23_011432 [Cyclotella cryptica]|uniref:Uncharacterized protein n=1 Tax=Cyclotella cryptica TaxID=29204 RepID=A0ABD3PKF9_9STRA|eukprot:CCRYP_013729-RA/>CCRYP_013729-RA protein AED:0.24 eAED:0.24 QI:0/-1/0/1/-1/1/1/0/311
MTRYLVLLALALEANAAMALPRQQPVPAPSPSLSPTLPKVVKVPPGSLSSSSSGAAVPSQQQTPSVAVVESPSIMDAKAPKLPPDEGKVPPPPQETPGKDPKPTVVQGGGGGGNVVSVSTAAPTFVLNDDEAANEVDETPMEPSAESVVSMMPTFLPTEYASGLISESPFLSKSLPTYFPTVSTEELFLPFPTMIPTRDVGLSSDGQVSPMDTQTDSGNNKQPNGTHSSIYLSDAVTQSTLVPEEFSISRINDNTAPQPLSSDTILQYGLISVSLGFILSSVATLGVMRRRVTAHKRSEDLPSTLANGSVL